MSFNDMFGGFGNIDFSKHNYTLEELREKSEKERIKLASGNYAKNVTVTKDGRVFAEYANGKKEEYPVGYFNDVGPAPAVNTLMNHEKQITPLMKQPESTASQHPVVEPKPAVVNTRQVQTTATKISTTFATASNVPPEFEVLIKKHQNEMKRALINGRVNLAITYAGEEMHNPAVIADAELVIEEMEKSEYRCDADVVELKAELQNLLTTFKECEENSERVKLLEEIKEKINEIKELFAILFNINILSNFKEC